MTLQQLEYVVALDTYRHYVKAAKKCYVTQPTLTIQVKKLEEELGFKIFDKSKQPFRPTPLGKMFIERARKILHMVAEMKAMIQEEVENLEGTFRLAVIPTIAPYLIPRFFGPFSKAHPHTHIHIEEFESTQILSALHRGEIDMAILAGPINEPFIREIPLYDEPFVFYGHPELFSDKSHLSVDDLKGISNVWVLKSGHCLRNQVLHICNQTDLADQTIRFQSGSIEALKRMVERYGGFTLVPEMAVQPHDPGRYLRFTAPQPVREVCLATHINFHRMALLRAIQRSISHCVPSHFKPTTDFIRVPWR